MPAKTPTAQFDLLRLPAELRTIIYEFYFTSDSLTDLHLIIHPTPDSNLLATSKGTHKEALLTYENARRQYQSRREQVWQTLIDKLKSKLRVVFTQFGIVDHDVRRLRTAVSAAENIKVGRRIVSAAPQSHRHGRAPWRCDCDFTAPLHQKCRICSYLLLLAVYFSAFSEQLPSLLSEHFHGGLSEMGAEIHSYLQALPYDFVADFHCARDFGVDFWRFELDKQEFIDLRCNIRFDAVKEFYYKYDCLESEFNEIDIYGIEKEMMWPELKAYEDFEVKCVFRKLQWEDEYERRAAKMQEQWREEGSRVFELIPPKASGAANAETEE